MKFNRLVKIIIKLILIKNVREKSHHSSYYQGVSLSSNLSQVIGLSYLVFLTVMSSSVKETGFQKKEMSGFQKS